MNLIDYQSRIEVVLKRELTNSDIPSRLLQAMNYSTLNGGKRIRALLVYAAGEVVQAPLEQLDNVAAAIECIHSYSLIHDDLPAMDDDDLRRGKPTNHKQFDEATAILAGDALLTFAFELINNRDSNLSDTQARKISAILSESAGAIGMVGGQILDIQATGKELTQAQLEDMHRRKTGALIRAAAMCGGLCIESGNLNKEIAEKLESYANNIGLAFQVVDDILDIEASTEELGKTSGADIDLGKVTYPSLIGLDASKQLAKNLYNESIKSIHEIGENTELLSQIAELVISRRK